MVDKSTRRTFLKMAGIGFTSTELYQNGADGDEFNAQQYWQDVTSSTWNWPYEQSDIGLKEYHKQTGDRGEGRSVLVIDTGFDKEHPLYNPVDVDGGNESFKPYHVNVYGKIGSSSINDIDDRKHGTKVLGVVWQVAPNAEYHLARVDPDFFNKDWGENDMVKSLRQAKNSAIDYDVILTSSGYPKDSVPDRTVENTKRLSNEVADNSTNFIAASGNSENENSEDHKVPILPSSAEEALSVSSTNAVGEISIENSPRQAKNGKPNIAAPGVNIFTLGKGDEKRELNKVSYPNPNGSSVAAPFVAGIALLLQKHGSAEEVQQALLETAKEIPDTNLDGAGHVSMMDAYQRLTESGGGTPNEGSQEEISISTGNATPVEETPRFVTFNGQVENIPAETSVTVGFEYQDYNEMWSETKTKELTGQEAIEFSITERMPYIGRSFRYRAILYDDGGSIVENGEIREVEVPNVVDTIEIETVDVSASGTSATVTGRISDFGKAATVFANVDISGTEFGDDSPFYGGGEKSNPVELSRDGSGEFSLTFNDLDSGREYWARATAYLSFGPVRYYTYGDAISFETSQENVTEESPVEFLDCSTVEITGDFEGWLMEVGYLDGPYTDATDYFYGGDYDDPIKGTTVIDVSEISSENEYPRYILNVDLSKEDDLTPQFNVEPDYQVVNPISPENCNSGADEHTLEVVPVGVEASYRIEVSGTLEPADINGRDMNPDDKIKGSTATGRVQPGAEGDSYRYSGEIVDITIQEGDAEFLKDGTKLDTNQRGGEHTLEVVPVGVEASYRVDVSGDLQPANINGRDMNPDDEIEGNTVTGKVQPGAEGDSYRYTGEIVEITMREGDAKFLKDGTELDKTTN